MTPAERPVSAVPAWVWALLALLLTLQLGWRSWQQPVQGAVYELPPAPRAGALRVASLGEPAALARVAMLYVQSFDLGAASGIPYRKLDYASLIAWLRAILAADPLSEYPLFSAARLYSENPDPAKTRAMLEFIREAFMLDPDRRWPWLAHAALLAKHRLKDLGLARRYAGDVARHATADNVPDWARQMEIFILEDMNELQAARIMLGGLLATGRIRDPAERRFLQDRLEQLEQRLREQGLTESPPQKH